ncbi:MAG: hypothetical protein HONDAALG_02534 [Gammaproteobacteria bacterium]|nr:hypothetical protein [Gammaproteobacteria bacterium]
MTAMSHCLRYALILLWLAPLPSRAEEVRPSGDVIGTDPSAAADAAERPKADMLPGYGIAPGEAPRGWVEGLMMGGVMPRSADIRDLPEPDSEGARLLNQYCTQCHGLPTPDQHSAEGWFPVVERMRMRLRWMATYSNMRFAEPTAAENVLINQYLAEHGRKPAPAGP